MFYLFKKLLVFVSSHPTRLKDTQIFSMEPHLYSHLMRRFSSEYEAASSYAGACVKHFSWGKGDSTLYFSQHIE